MTGTTGMTKPTEMVGGEYLRKGRVSRYVRSSICHVIPMWRVSLFSFFASRGPTIPIHVQRGPYISVDFLAGSIKARELSPETVDLITLTGIRESAYGVAFAIGRSLNNIVWFLPNRFEVEYSFRVAEFDFGPGPFDIGKKMDMTAAKHTLADKLQSHVFMLNVYSDFSTEGRFRPYIGAGIGFAINRTELTTVNDDEMNEDLKTNKVKHSKSGGAWNLRVGFHYQFNNALDLNLYFEHAQTGNVAWEIKTSAIDPSPLMLIAKKLNNDTLHIGMTWQIEDLT